MSESIHPQAYGHTPEIAEGVRPDLSDRAGVCREMIALCTAQLDGCGDPNRCARLHYECARLYETPLCELDAALDHYGKARALRSQHLPTLAGLRRVLMLKGDWEAATKTLAEEIDLTESPEERAALLFERALIFEERLNQGAEAAASYQAALGQARGDASILRALSRARRRDGNHAALRDVVDAQASLAQDDPALLAARLSQRGRITERYTQAAEEACVFYERAVEADVMASGALWQAARLRGARGQFAELVALERRRVETLSDPGLRAAVLCRTADVLSEHLGDTAGAIVLLEQAAQEVPGDLAPLCRLVQHYDDAGDHDARVRTLERMEAAAGDDRLRLEFRLALADVHRSRRGDIRAAIHWLGLARQLDPNNPLATDALADLYRQQQDWPSLAGVLAAREEASDAIDLRAALHVELAELCERHLGDVDGAIEHHRTVLSLCPEHPGAFRGLARLLRLKRRYSELAELHQRAVELAADDAEAVSHLLEVALIQEDLLDAPQAALGSFQRVLERDPNNRTALRGAQRLAETTGNPALAIQLLERELGLIGSSTRKIPLMLRIGEICERQLDDEAQALAVYEKVLSVDGANRPALAAVARIHRRAGRYGQLVDTVRQEAAVLSGANTRSEHLLSVARLVEEQLADRTLALEYCRKAHEEDPPSERAARALERMLAATRRFEELAAELDARLPRLRSPNERLRVALELARIRETRLGEPSEALLAYDTALAADPNSTSARLGRVRCLGQLGQLDELLGELERLSTLAGDPAMQLGCLLYSGELLEGELGRTQSAIACYEQVLATLPDHRGALVALERLYEAQRQSGDLMRILARQAASFRVRSEQVASLRELSRVGHRDQPCAEICRDSALKILEHQPGDLRALLDLELQFLATQNAKWLAQTDTQWVRSSISGSRRAAHRTRLAEFLEPLNAVQALEQHRPALREDPGNVGSARGISRIAEAIGDVELLTEAAELEVSVVRSPERAATLLRSAARIERAAGRPKEAGAILARALAVYPDDADSADTLSGLMNELGEHEQLISILTTAAATATKTQVRAGHWISAARLLAHARGDLGAAIAALRRVAESEPDHAPLLLELGELYVDSRQWEQAARCFEKALRIEHDAPLGKAARLRLAELYHEHLARAEEAAALLREVVREAPQELGAQRRLLAIEIAAGDESAESTALAWVHGTSGKEKAEALTTLGRLQRDAGKSAEAVASLAQAVALSGVDEPARGDLLQMLEKQDYAGSKANWDAYVRALVDFCRTNADADEKARALLEVSSVLTDRMNDAEEGYAALAAGLKFKPGDLVLQTELCARLCQARQYQRALPELYKLLELDPSRVQTWADLCTAFQRLGKNAEEHLAMGPLVMLGGGTDLQRATWNVRQPGSVCAADGSVDATVLQAATRFGLPEPVRSLLAQLASVAMKVMEAGPERWGMSTKDRVGARGLHPSRLPLDRVGRAFGIADIDLYPADGEPPVSLVLTEPPGIVIPASFDGLTDAQQIFCLARHVASIARKTHVVAALGAESAELLLGAAAATVGIEVAVPGFDAEQVAETGRRVAKAIPWLSKGRFEDAARGYGMDRPESISTILRELDRAALRIALVLSDDLSCLALVKERGTPLLGLSRADLSATVEDLLTFWISPGAMAIRRQIGTM
ncbi:MAG: tetratricopeptide repeat protein [Polyangiaceae bacterium]|nr:tetratricopeptide repeat protein [Polyangiaceae bacterium]